MNLKPFGKYICSCREARELTREAFADRSGLSVDAIQQLEEGTLSPDLRMLRALGAGLELELSALFDDFERGKTATS